MKIPIRPGHTKIKMHAKKGQFFPELPFFYFEIRLLKRKGQWASYQSDQDKVPVFVASE
jgi:hypothetical protein